MLRRCVILLMLLGANLGCGSNPPPPVAKASFKPTKETTFITEPVDADGYLDYEAALNERLRGKVVPETNANVLLWQALGPKPEGRPMHADYWTWLQMDPPKDEGEYFIDSKVFLQKQGQTVFDDTFNNLEERLSQEPWSAKDHPEYAAWLQANARPLELVRQASLRKEYYNPLVSRTEKGERGFLLDSPLPNVQQSRAAAYALLRRAMLQTSEGKFDAAWNDLLTVQRLARGLARGGTLIEILVGCAIGNRGYQAALAFLERSNPDVKQAVQRLNDLQTLPPMPEVFEALDKGERFSLLDVIQTTSQRGFDSLEDLGKGRSPRTPDAATRMLLGKLDWDVIFRLATATYDRVGKILRQRDRAVRMHEWEKFAGELRERRDALGDNANIGGVMRNGGDPGPAMSEKIGKILVTLLFPAVHKILATTDRFEQEQRNLQLAFALAAYRANYGKYPAALADLAPKYLAKIPDDLFSSKPLVYKPSNSGYLLYSVGENGKDDGGASFGDDPTGDDLPVRMK